MSFPSGHTKDGMSVRWYTMRIEAVDADTLSLTWASLPQDGLIDVVVARVASVTS